MLNLDLKNPELEKQLNEIIEKQFNGDTEEMVKWIIGMYKKEIGRSDFSGILKWDRDGLQYQKELRSEWG